MNREQLEHLIRASAELTNEYDLARYTSLTYNSTVLTIYETPIFVAEAAKIWSDDERLAFFAWIATEPEAGDVIPGSGGCRKVRWSRRGMGKRGGARVIYFTRLQAGELCMLLVYAKAGRDTIPARFLKEVREELEDGFF